MVETQVELESIKGRNEDILMLVSHICGQYHQAIPTWEDCVNESQTNPYMRFQTKMMLCGKVVSRGLGQNKKEAKVAASKIFVEMLYPRVYKEWLKQEGTTDKEPMQFSQIELPPLEPKPKPEKKPLQPFVPEFTPEWQETL